MQNIVADGIAEALIDLCPSLRVESMTINGTTHVNVQTAHKFRITKNELLTYSHNPAYISERLKHFTEQFIIWNSTMRLFNIVIMPDHASVEIPNLVMQIMQDLNPNFEWEHTVHCDGSTSSQFLVSPLGRDDPWYIEFPRICAYDHPTALTDLINDIRECSTMMAKTLEPILLQTIA